MGIRLATPGDAAQIRAIYAPMVQETAITFETVPPTVAEMRRRIQELMPKHPWLVHETHGHLDGYAYASPHRARGAYRWSVEVSAYIRVSSRRKGIASGLYLRLFELLKRQGYANALAGITLPNPASVGFHEALGFERVGTFSKVGYKLGLWRDVGWWQLQLNMVDPPSEPLSVADALREPSP